MKTVIFELAMAVLMIYGIVGLLKFCEWRDEKFKEKRDKQYPDVNFPD